MNLRNRLPFYISLIQQGLEWFGYPLICTKAKAKPLKNYKVYGNTSQGGLPEGYTRLKSLSSTGYEYINTGLVMKSGDEIELDYEWLGNTPSELSSDMMFFGCQNIDTTRGGLWVELYRREAGLPTWYARFGGTSSNSATASVDHITGRHLLNINQQRLTIDNSQVVVLTSSVGTFQTTPLTLFGRMNATGTQLNSARIKMFGLKVINNGVVRLNLIPCKNADNILGMYDTVTGQFLTNQGTGEFIAGEVIQPTPTNPVEIESVGDKTKNLFSGAKGLPEATTMGVTFHPNEDGTITVSGTATGYCDFVLNSFYISDEISNRTIVLSGLEEVVNVVWGLIRVRFKDGSYQTHWTGGGSHPMTFDLTQYPNVELLQIWIKRNNNIATSGIIKPMIELGDTATPYEPYGYKIPVTVNVNIKNLFNKDGEITNWYSSARVITTASANRTLAIRHIPGTEYYYKHCNVSGGGRYFYTNVENPEVGSEASVMYGATIIQPNQVGHVQDLPDDTKWVFFNAGRSGQTTTIQEQLDDFMVTTTPIDENTPYAPYFNETTNIYLDEPLRKLGDYVDYIDYAEQKVVRNVYRQTDIYGNPSISAGRYLCDANAECISNIGEITIAWSNLLQDGSAYAYGEFSNIYNYIGMYRNSKNVPRIVISKILECQTVEDFQNALKGIEIYYPLATPTEESITLPEITLPGEVTITTETTVKPSDMYGKQ